MKIDVCPGDDLQTFYPSEADGLDRVGRSKLIQTNSTEPDVERLMNLAVKSHERFDVWPRPKSRFCISCCCKIMISYLDI